MQGSGLTYGPRLLPAWRRKPAECRAWAQQELCWQDPRFMHWHCRESCGLCRLPTGRPQRSFASADAASGGEASGEQQRQQRQRQHGAGAGKGEEWHALHALHASRLPGEGEDGGDGGSRGARSDLTRGMLYGALAAWAFLLAAVFGALVRSAWSSHHARHGPAAEQRARHVLARVAGGGGGGSGRASPSFPLLR